MAGNVPRETFSGDNASCVKYKGIIRGFEQIPAAEAGKWQVHAGKG